MHFLLENTQLITQNRSKGAGGGFTLPQHGTIVEPTENGLIYVPDNDFCGYDSFVYTITSGGLEDSAKVTIHILCAGKTPSPSQSPTVMPISGISHGGILPFVDCTIETADDMAIVNADAIVAISPLDNDSCDDYLDELHITSTTNPAHGMAEIKEEKSIKYTPNSDACSDPSIDSITDSFLYTVETEAGSSDFATIYVDICCSCGTSSNTPPFALDDEASTSANVPVTVKPLRNDGDVDDGDSLVVTGIAVNGVNGSCVIVDNGQAVTYTPGKPRRYKKSCIFIV